MITIVQTSEPEAALEQCLGSFLNSGRESDGYAFSYVLRQDYLPGAPELPLLAILALRRQGQSLRLRLSITEHSDELLRAMNCLRSDWDRIEQWCRERGLIWLDPDQPLRLQAVHIPKPWGQEIWYTGIEARGQSRVADEQGREIPLPWLLSLCPHRILGPGAEGLILLKVLDPLPEPVFGDLYFEMHEEKQEVYVVTHVDRGAWPDGRGGIRFGFDQAARARAGSDEQFKNLYLSAVRAYREIRQCIDERLDDCRRDAGVPLDAPVEPQTLKSWLNALPKELLTREAERREHMESFIHVSPLQVGDVVKVPCLTPHSLLHGVRTVEFQTPVYERKILSFAQKVLTQSHWDTEEALGQVAMDRQEAARLPVVSRDDACLIEEVVNFDDFRVERLSLAAGRSREVDTGEQYALLMTVSEGIGVNELMLGAEQALILPPGAVISVRSVDESDRADERAGAIVLLARPKTRLG